MNFFTPLTTCLSMLLLGVPQDSANDVDLARRQALLDGEVLVHLTDREDDVMGMRGDIFIEAAANDIWPLLVDYNNLARFLPTMLYSKLLSVDDSVKVVDQIMRAKVAFFEKKIRTKLEIKEDYLKRVGWQILSGDFHVYNGSWEIESDQEAGGAFLTYRAEMKPRFFAPKVLSRQIQRKDIPATLRAIRERVARVRRDTESRER